jgi:hypothetical protein
MPKIYRKIADLEFRHGEPRSAPLSAVQAEDYKAAGFDVRPVYEEVQVNANSLTASPWIVTHSGGALALRSSDAVLIVSGPMANDRDAVERIASILNGNCHVK